MEDGDAESDEDYEEREDEDEGEKPPSQRLEDKLAEQNAKWEGMSLTQRYALNLLNST